MSALQSFISSWFIVHSKKQDKITIIYKPQAKRTNNHFGFTLIELMVSIAIVAILATIGITAYGTTQQTARDARRKSELKAIADSIEATKTGRGNTYLYTVADFGNDFGRTTGNNLPYFDPQGRHYCFHGRATVGLTGNPSVVWTTACPSPFQRFNESLAGAGAVPAADNLAGGTVASWIICTALERAALSPNTPTAAPTQIYCINSTQ